METYILVNDHACVSFTTNLNGTVTINTFTKAHESNTVTMSKEEARKRWRFQSRAMERVEVFPDWMTMLLCEDVEPEIPAWLKI